MKKLINTWDKTNIDWNNHAWKQEFRFPRLMMIILAYGLIYTATVMGLMVLFSLIIKWIENGSIT